AELAPRVLRAVGRSVPLCPDRFQPLHGIEQVLARAVQGIAGRAVIERLECGGGIGLPELSWSAQTEGLKVRDGDRSLAALQAARYLRSHGEAPQRVAFLGLVLRAVRQRARQPAVLHGLVARHAALHEVLRV